MMSQGNALFKLSRISMYASSLCYLVRFAKHFSFCSFLLSIDVIQFHLVVFLY